jgi:PAS domain S-box-containing protein
MSKKLALPLIAAETGLFISLGATALIALLAYQLPTFSSPFLLVLLMGGLFSVALFIAMEVMHSRQAALSESAKLSAQAIEQQAIYHAVIAQAREVLFQISSNGQWKFLSPEWERLTGFTISQTIGTDFLDYVQADDRPGIQNQFKSLIAGERDTSKRMLRLQSKMDGSRWVEIYTRASVDAQGIVQSVEGSFFDVTERVRAVDALQASEEKYRLLCHTTTDTIVMMDKTGCIDYVNPAAMTLFGYTQDQLIGQNISLLQPERLREAHRRGMERYKQQGVKSIDWRSTKTSGLHADGRELPIEVAFNHSYVGDKEVFFGFMRSIS